MSSELDDLYQELILDHHRRPQNFREMKEPSHRAAGVNPLCGDEVTVFLDVADGVVRDVSFQGKGCAISRASASLMTGSLKGKSVEEANELFRRFQALVTSDDGGDENGASGLGKLEALKGVRRFPSRVKCASLPWHTMRAALERRHEPVTTE